jgi:hypothetical protein
MPQTEEPAMPLRLHHALHHPLHHLPAAAGRHPKGAPAPRRWTGAAYAAVLLAALGSAWLQPGAAEAPAHDAALLSLASWAAGGLADGDAAARTPPATPAP